MIEAIGLAAAGRAGPPDSPADSESPSAGTPCCGRCGRYPTDPSVRCPSLVSTTSHFAEATSTSAVVVDMKTQTPIDRFLQPLRAAHTALPSRPAAPSVRRGTGWLTRRPDRLTDEDRAGRGALLARSPALATTGRLVRDFAEIMVDRRGHDLNAWIGRARREGSPALRSFAAGLVRDLDAATAGLTLPHSSGAVEGHVNRIILWNLRCQGHSRLRWLTEKIGSRVAVAGTPISRGVVPVGVGTSTSRSRRLSRAVCPSSTAARSSSLSGIAASMRCGLSLASNSCPLPDALGA